MEDSLFAPPRQVDRVEDCAFYHTMDIPGFGLVTGQWDLRGRLDDYLGGVDVKGKRVLDVGCASGFLSFDMESRGADVVSFDADSAERIHFLPFKDSLYSTRPEEWRRGTNAFLERLRNSYWLAHRAYGSQARVFYGDVYDLPESLGSFDVTVVGQILIHLRDPVTALASVARRCARTLVVAEGMIESEEPVARMHANAESGPEWVWWQYSVGTYRTILTMMGFRVVAVRRNEFSCSHDYLKGMVPINTIVAERVTPTAG